MSKLVYGWIFEPRRGFFGDREHVAACMKIMRENLEAVESPKRIDSVDLKKLREQLRAVVPVC